MTQGVVEAKAAEKRRLAEALRANLRRRKAAARGAADERSGDPPRRDAPEPARVPDAGERG